MARRLRGGAARAFGAARRRLGSRRSGGAPGVGVAGSRSDRLRRLPGREAVARHPKRARDDVGPRRVHGRRFPRRTAPASSGPRARRSPETWSSGTVATRLGVSSAAALEPRRDLSPLPRRDAAEAGLGAPRRDPPQRLTNRLIDGIWPGSGVAVLDFDQDGYEDLFVADGVRSILYRNDGTRALHGRHRARGPRDLGVFGHRGHGRRRG